MYTLFKEKRKIFLNVPKRNIFFQSLLYIGKVGGLTPCPVCFTPGKGKGYPLYRRLHAPQIVGGCEKSHHLLGFKPGANWIKISQFILGPSDIIL